MEPRSSVVALQNFEKFYGFISVVYESLIKKMWSTSFLQGEFTPCYTRQFLLQLGCIASYENNCSCNTPFSQLAKQQNVALQVARKVGLSSTFRNVARQIAACNMSSAICNVFHSSSLRCKPQEKLPRLTWPYSPRSCARIRLLKLKPPNVCEVLLRMFI